MPTTGLPATIPGTSMLGYGYDVFADPYCSAGASKGHGGRPLLNNLDASTDDAREVEVLGRTFRCPSMIRLLTEQTRSGGYTIFGKTVEEYNNQLTVNAKVGAEFGAFSGSIETSHSQSTSTYLENIYGEHGYVYNGIELQLPLTASELRSHLKPQVKAILEDGQAHPAKDIITRFGTHLVAGVMIGGKASLRQYSSRSDVTNTSEWQVAVQVKYDELTASASVDEKSRSHFSKFRMSNTVQTLGGSIALVATPVQFDAWRQSLDGHPAIIETTTFVPLWQLLEPGARRDALKEAILSYARRFQAGALYGSLEQHNSSWILESAPDAPDAFAWVDGTTRGKAIGRRFKVTGSAESWSETYTRGTARLWLWLSTGMEKTDLQGLAVYGGRQMQSSYDSSQPLKEISSWGSRTSKGKQLQEIDYFQVFTNSSAGYGDRGFSHINLFVGPIEEAQENAWVVVGGHTLSSSGRRGSDWGQPMTGYLVEQDIATSGMWKDFNKTEIGHIFLHLQKVANQLTEIPE